MRVVENIFIQKINKYMRLNESLKDLVTNAFLNVSTWTKVKVFKKKYGNTNSIKSNLKLSFEDNFSKFNTKKWRIGQEWGLFHTASPYQYYGDTSVYVEDGHLVLDQKYSPKKLTTWENDKVYDIPYSVGLISSLDSYGYGFYEFEVKLPRGKGLWPAVWLSCDKSWPPEIDINESYSNEDGSYKGKLESNFHFNFNENKTMSGARSHIVFNDSEIIKFSLWWTKDFMKIYYNDHIVRQITSEKTLNWFRDKKMIIILNNALRPEYLQYVDKQVSKFHIYSVKVWV